MEIKSLHTHVDIITRSKGASVIAKAAYNSRDKLQDEYYGKTHDYSKKEDLVFSGIRKADRFSLIIFHLLIFIHYLIFIF